MSLNSLSFILLCSLLLELSLALCWIFSFILPISWPLWYFSSLSLLCYIFSALSSCSLSFSLGVLAYLLIVNLPRFYFQWFYFYFLEIIFHIWLVFVDSILIFYVFIPFFMSAINLNIYFIVFIWLFHYVKVLEVGVSCCLLWLLTFIHSGSFSFCVVILDCELNFRKDWFMRLGNGPG